MTDGPLRTIEWLGGLDGCVSMIDQTKLPGELVRLECRDAQCVWDAIKRLSVRGAPAIGIAAAMGTVLGMRAYDGNDRAGFLSHLDEVCEHLATSRPTAVNLFWALGQMRRRAQSCGDATVAEIKLALLDEAKKIRDDDAAMCRAIGEHGAALIKEGAGILTHCNAGGLATAEFGTALAPMYVAHQRGCSFRVFADETRPLLQGSRLTAWELAQAGIDVTVLCDSMAAALMREGKVNLVITGADRIAANGDVANKIGTYGLATLAQAHDIPFYVAAPSSTFDLSTPNGSAIPIEWREAAEFQASFDKPTVPKGVACYTPAFDVTPARLIAGLVTENGLIHPVGAKEIAEIVSNFDYCSDNPSPA